VQARRRKTSRSSDGARLATAKRGQVAQLLLHSLTKVSAGPESAILQRSSEATDSYPAEKPSEERPCWLWRDLVGALPSRGPLHSVSRHLELEQGVPLELRRRFCRVSRPADPEELAFVREHGIDGLYALVYASGPQLYDHAGGVERAAAVLGSANTADPDDPHHSAVSDLSMVIGEEVWADLQELAARHPTEHLLIINTLLSALHSSLVHPTGDEDPLTQRDDGRWTAGCPSNTRLIVHGLWALGVPAIQADQWEIVDGGGHIFPWFPSIGVGLFHGDDVLPRRSQPHSLPKLRTWGEIAVRWRQVVKAERAED